MVAEPAYATFSTPIDRRALQVSIISAQHFCTRRATIRHGFSSSAALQPSSLVSANGKKLGCSGWIRTDYAKPVTIWDQRYA